MNSQRIWAGAAALGLIWGTTIVRADDPEGPSLPLPPAPKAEAPKEEPPKPALRTERQPVWRIFIAPRCAPEIIADFYDEPDGSLSVIHRSAAHGLAATENVQQAPPPAPAPEPKPAPPEEKTPSATRPRGSVFFASGSGADPATNPTEDKTPSTAPALPTEPPAPPATGNAKKPEDVPAAPAVPAGPAAPAATPQPLPPDHAYAYPPPAIPGGRPSYAEIYASIPFIRSEYNANRSYRHDTTMELLFGQMRPTVVNKYAGPPPPNRYYTYWYFNHGVHSSYNYPSRPVYYRPNGW